MALLDKTKVALRVTTNAFDDEITDLINAALADLGIVDIRPELLTASDPLPLVQRAVMTYCRLHFGEPEDYERLKESYDEQKSQLLMNSTYTEW
jgi:hypothetical protein